MTGEAAHPERGTASAEVFSAEVFVGRSCASKYRIDCATQAFRPRPQVTITQLACGASTLILTSPFSVGQVGYVLARSPQGVATCFAAALFFSVMRWTARANTASFVAFDSGSWE